MPSFVKIAAVDDIPADSMRAFVYDGQRIAIYRVGESFYATSDICSHEYAELSEGFLDADDCTVECPLHGSRFDIRSGAALTLPAFQPIQTYPVRVEGDDVLVELYSSGQSAGASLQ
ncbi:MAG: non-heme iron oxygenase ferredoxin subunit [Kouleothrix sp.]|nr:non-heme iron oxygenase ferredoxin subunit [Kouleothrix sp.]